MWLILLIIWIVTESSDITAKEGGAAALAVVAMHYLFLFYATSKGRTVQNAGFEVQLGGHDERRN